MMIGPMTKIISDDIDECDTSTDYIDCSSTANTTPIHIDRSADTNSNCYSMTPGSTRRMMARRRHSKLLRFHGASLVLMFMIASILLFVDSMTTTCCCYAAMNDNHDIMLHQTLHHTDDTTATTPQRRLLMRNDPSINKKKNRILYIITALAEYNSGTRNTVRGSDRLQETLIPVVSEGVTSMIKDGYDVDVFLVAHFILQPERAALITKALPENVGFDYWNEATPLGYDTGSNKLDRTLENRTLHLARQHRFVIKDKLMQYDIFVVFEDDMLITADHVNHYVAVTNELRRLEELAPVDVPPSSSSKSPITTKDEVLQQYHGTMTKGQLRRMIPGFMRVEVLLDEEHYPAQSKTGPIPVDLLFTKDGKQSPEATTVNATSCCYISDHLSNENRPGQPNADQLMIWETNILPLGIRKMPTDSWLDWVVLQRGPNQNDLNVNETIGDYWSNRNADYYGPKEKRPAPQEFKYINNMGGWMATREQLWRWHTEICPGGFLPPYEGPHYKHDGLDMRNVEWYSGGMQLSTVRHACNMQRIILLEPKQFSKSLLYHTANNKQRQLTDKREGTFTKANTLLGQLNTLKKRAEKEIE